ncbi:hypothetical protein BDA99DRAFT_544605 [Phascolomyces articulosus]|uniref:Uncharacterized protein n=1 Tax=Phascolomyces articulosus TaxID=60185 RepID=A0AAD5P6R6_9FUNG|nr:hypothetical protein BDA99DRAFT_544605 [Phascolomyces articulosus]
MKKGIYRIPSDLRSQALSGLVSTMVGDHMGIPGAWLLELSGTLDNQLLSWILFGCKPADESFIELKVGDHPSNGLFGKAFWFCHIFPSRNFVVWQMVKHLSLEDLED